MILNEELNIQFRKGLARWLQSAKGGLGAGIVLFFFGCIARLDSRIDPKLLQTSAKNLVLPEAFLLLAGILTCCVCLAFASWRPTDYLLRRWIGQPFMALAFDICGIAFGALIPVLLLISRPDQYFKAIILGLMMGVFFFLSGGVFWVGRWLLSDRIHSYVEQHPSMLPKAVVTITANTLIFVFLVISKVN